ncbi:MAG TPA: formylglycine-generating enzyme family protein [Chthonomonadaceae bacterium]|nr:formylglycine-generating enzyme family protein [Chthonomonadaceae bacterium]
MERSIDYKTWMSYSESEQDAMVSWLQAQLGVDYVHCMTRSYASMSSLRIPTFLHRPSGMEFNLLFGGSFQMGLSEEEEKAVLENQDEIQPDELFVETHRPVHTVHVNPFLITRFPCTVSQAENAIALDPDILRYPDIRKLVSDSNLQESTKHQALDLTRSEAETLAAKYDFSLPSEAQWEYACRGLTTTPFYFDTKSLNKEKLEKEILIRDFDDPELCLKAANPFGLVGLSVGEWCQDSYRRDYTDASDNDLPVLGPAPFVVRGGALSLWPWQGCGEWKHCLSAYRMSSNVFVEASPTWGARFVTRFEAA